MCICMACQGPSCNVCAGPWHQSKTQLCTQVCHSFGDVAMRACVKVAMCLQEYGPIYKSFGGSRPFVFVASPELVRQVLLANTYRPVFPSIWLGKEREFDKANILVSLTAQFSWQPHPQMTPAECCALQWSAIPLTAHVIAKSAGARQRWRLGSDAP